MFINTTGIILRDVKYSDNSRMLTLLTSDRGKLSASAHGTYRKNSKLAAGTELLAYSHLTLTQRRERWTVTEAQVIELFEGLRDDLELLSLGSYIAELTETAADEDSPGPQLLSLCLNTLYALSEKIKPPELIKPAFELRLMAVAGYAPLLVENGSASSNESDEGVLTLTKEASQAAQYILGCKPKKLFSFSLEGKALTELSTATERFLLRHLDRGFRTLDFYKKIKDCAYAGRR